MDATVNIMQPKQTWEIYRVASKNQAEICNVMPEKVAYFRGLDEVQDGSAKQRDTLRGDVRVNHVFHMTPRSSWNVSKASTIFVDSEFLSFFCSQS